MIEFVTPEIAAEMLGENEINRSLSTATYEAYAADMLAGRWKAYPNNGIMFGKRTGLIDGQHRLRAIIAAGNQDPDFKGVDIYVYRDVDDNIRSLVDLNRPRNIGDVLTMEKHPHGALAGAAARLILNWVDNERMGARRTKPETAQFCRDNQDIFNYARMARSAGTAIRPAPLTAVMFLGGRAKDSTDQSALVDAAERFVAGIAGRTELAAEDARLALCNAIWGQRSGGKLNIGWAVAASAHAWNFFVAGRPTSSIRVTQDQAGEYSIPPIIGAPERGCGLKRLGDANVPDAVLRRIAELRRSAEPKRVAGEERASA